MITLFSAPKRCTETNFTSWKRKTDHSPSSRGPSWCTRRGSPSGWHVADVRRPRSLDPCDDPNVLWDWTETRQWNQATGKGSWNDGTLHCTSFNETFHACPKMTWKFTVINMSLHKRLTSLWSWSRNHLVVIIALIPEKDVLRFCS